MSASSSSSAPPRTVHHGDALPFLLGNTAGPKVTFTALADSLAEEFKAASSDETGDLDLKPADSDPRPVLFAWRRKQREVFNRAVDRVASSSSSSCPPNSFVFTGLPYIDELRWSPQLSKKLSRNSDSLYLALQFLNDHFDKEYPQLAASSKSDPLNYESYPDFHLYRQFVLNSVKAVLLALPLDSLAIFAQTDTKESCRTQLSVSFLVNLAVEELKEDFYGTTPYRLAWHKICSFNATGAPLGSGHGPEYTHVLCITKGDPPASAQIWLRGEWEPDAEEAQCGQFHMKKSVKGRNIVVEDNSWTLDFPNNIRFSVEEMDRKKDRVLLRRIVNLKGDNDITSCAVPYSPAVWYNRVPNSHTPDRHWSDLRLPDIIPRGTRPTHRAMGLEFATAVLRWVQQNFALSCVVDPFCGSGVVLGVGNEVGFEAVGNDLSTKRVRMARGWGLSTREKEGESKSEMVEI